jgi:hypothetical protein
VPPESAQLETRNDSIHERSSRAFRERHRGQARVGFASATAASRALWPSSPQIQLHPACVRGGSGTGRRLEGSIERAGRITGPWPGGGTVAEPGGGQRRVPARSRPRWPAFGRPHRSSRAACLPALPPRPCPPSVQSRAAGDRDAVHGRFGSPTAPPRASPTPASLRARGRCRHDGPRGIDEALPPGRPRPVRDLRRRASGQRPPPSAARLLYRWTYR